MLTLGRLNTGTDGASMKMYLTSLIGGSFSGNRPILAGGLLRGGALAAGVGALAACEGVEQSLGLLLTYIPPGDRRLTALQRSE